MENQTQQTDKMKKIKRTGVLLFTGTLFIVMAAGWYFGYFKNIGLVACMGTGFILTVAMIAVLVNKK